jgi:GT2 family glycosyltransferase
MPKLSVIIPHYRDLDRLNLCLAALGRQTYPAGDFEVIVADNASPEGEEAVARVIAGRARLVVVREKGAGPARNGAVAKSRGNILAFIDSDCVPEPDWLSEGVEALSEYDFIGGSVTVLVDDPRRRTPAEAFESVFAFDFKTYITKKGFTGAGNLFCTRAVFDQVGGFRAGVSEDVDWSHRATAVGLRLGYAPKAVVGHPARRTWPELEAKWRKTNRESFELIRGKRGGRFWWLVKSAALPLSAVVHSPKVLMSNDLNSFSQRLSALAMLYRVRFWRLGDALRLLMSG